MFTAINIRLLAAGIRCNQCKRYFTDTVNVHAIKDWGYCLFCDKLELNQPFYSEVASEERE